MKRIILAVSLLLVLVASLIAAEMTADDLVAKYMTALGGEQNLRALKSMTMKGTMFAQGQSLDLKANYVLPGKSYMEIAMGGMIMQIVATNGKDAWTKSPMTGTFYMTGPEKDEALEQAEIFPLLDYKKNGAKVKYLGEDMVKGAKALKLEYVGTKNDTVIYFFDATTFLAVKQKRGPATTTLSDYRKVGSIMMPYKMGIQADAQTMMMSIDTIAVNVAVSESLFVMPKDAKPLDSLKAMQQRMMQQQPGGGGK